jgi:hypothetical protein
VLLCQSIANQDSLKAELKQYVSPYVVNDLPEFSDASALSNAMMLRCAAWSLLLNADESYEQDDYGNLIVPVSELSRYAKQMFGEDTELEPDSDYYGSLAISYDAEQEAYLIPQQPDYATYYPQIGAVHRTSDGYQVEVKYIISDLLTNLKADSEDVVVKTMQYTLEETDDGYRVTAISLLSVEADSGTKWVRVSSSAE